ncbi:MAG: PA2169 family four-helix-bundle protein [Flavobacteriales bacterium]
MDRQAHIRELNDLYQLMADGRKGYSEASKRAEKPRIKELLAELSARREGLEDRLGNEIRRFKPDDHTQEGTLKGVLHRAWIDIRESIGKSDDVSVLDECERGERYLLERMDSVIKDQEVAADSRAMLTLLRADVEKDLSLLIALRSALGSVDR